MPAQAKTGQVVSTQTKQDRKKIEKYIYYYYYYYYLILFQYKLMPQDSANAISVGYNVTVSQVAICVTAD